MRQEKIPNFVWFLAGLGIGAVAGIVLAPQSGADTRQRLSRRAKEATDYVSTHSHDYLDYGRELYDKGRQMADEAAELFEEGRRLVEDAGEASEASAG